MEKNPSLFRAHGGATTPMYSLSGVQTWARVVDVYDGDTMTLVLPCLNGFYKFSVRMAGIDTCEIKSKVLDNKRKAIEARNCVIEWITNKPVASKCTRKDIQKVFEADVYLIWVLCKEFDKYGRLLADISMEPNSETTLAHQLIQRKLAYHYEGNTKWTEEEQLQKLS